MPGDLSGLGLAWCLAVIGVAYVVRGIAGFGSGLIAIPLLVMAMPITVAVPLVVALDFLASASHGIKDRGAVVWRDILPLLPFSVAGVLAALYVFKTIDPALLSKALGVFVIGFAVYLLATSRPERVGSRWWAMPAGGLGGFVGTLFGTGGPFYVIYLQLRGLNKTAFRASFATVFLLDGINRLAGYALSGLYSAGSLKLLGMALPAMALGLYAGGRAHVGIGEVVFRRGIGGLLVVSGAVLLIR